MTNENVIKLFLQGEKAQTNKRKINGGYYCYEGRTLTSNGDILINYSTVIAKKVYNNIYLNINKYSRTTSTIQNKIRQLANQQGFNVIECTEIIDKEVI